MQDLTIRRLNETETECALRLVWEVFLDYEAPDDTQAGVDAFYRSIHDARYCDARYCAYTARLCMGRLPACSQRGAAGRISRCSS